MFEENDRKCVKHLRNYDTKNVFKFFTELIHLFQNVPKKFQKFLQNLTDKFRKLYQNVTGVS